MPEGFLLTDKAIIALQEQFFGEGTGSFLLCLLGIHDWRYNCNGYTLDEWTKCSRCREVKHD